MTRIIFSSFIFFILLGCANDPNMGYSSVSLYTTQYRSVFVPIFKNNTMSKNLEFMLTDAVIKEIEARTPYQILGKEYAETEMTGTIRSVDLKTISQSRTTGLNNEVLFTIVIDFEWKNLQDGTSIIGRRNFSNSALFIPSRPSSEPMEIGKFAVIQQLSKDIVDQMQASW